MMWPNRLLGGVNTALQTADQTSELTVPDQTQGQVIFSLFTVAVILIALIVAYRRTRFAGLDTEQRRHKSHLLGAMRDQSPETLHIPRGAAADDYRDNLVAAFERVEQRARDTADPAHDPERVSIREAARSVARSLYETSNRTLPSVPQTALRLGSLAVTVAILGALAVSTEAIARHLVGAGGDAAPLIDSLVSHAIAYTHAAGDAMLAILALFPGAQTLASLVFAFGVLAGMTLYQHYYLVALALGLAAVAIAGLDRRVPAHVDMSRYRHDRSLVLKSVGALVGVWLAGIIPTAIGATIGDVSLVVVTIPFPALGAGLGALLALATLGLLAYVGLSSFARRVRYAATIDWSEGPDTLMAAYVLTTYLGTGVAFVAAPLVPAYLGAIIAQGSLVTLLNAYAAAGSLVQIGLLVALLVLLAGLAYVARDAWDDVRAAVAEAFARQAVRLALFQRAVTIAAGIFALGMVYTISRSLSIAIIGTLLFSALVYGGYTLIDRAAYRVSLVGDERGPKGTLVQCYALPDADEECHYVAKLGSDYRTSGATVDATVDDALTVAAATTSRETPPMTVGRKRAEDLLDRGRVDASVDVELRERVRKTFAYHTPDADPDVGKDELEELLSEYPESVWRPQVDRWRRLGIVVDHGDVLRREGDPWAAAEEDLSLSGGST